MGKVYVLWLQTARFRGLQGVLGALGYRARAALRFPGSRESVHWWRLARSDFASAPFIAARKQHRAAPCSYQKLARSVSSDS